VKNIYFAAGCKILDNEARAGLVDAEAARVFTRQKADPKVDDLKKEAEQDGLARASRQGECDYFQKNPGSRRGPAQGSERSQGSRAETLTFEFRWRAEGRIGDGVVRFLSSVGRRMTPQLLLPARSHADDKV